MLLCPLGLVCILVQWVKMTAGLFCPQGCAQCRFYLGRNLKSSSNCWADCTTWLAMNLWLTRVQLHWGIFLAFSDCGFTKLSQSIICTSTSCKLCGVFQLFIPGFNWSKNTQNYGLGNFYSNLIEKHSVQLSNMVESYKGGNRVLLFEQHKTFGTRRA